MKSPLMEPPTPSQADLGRSVLSCMDVGQNAAFSQQRGAGALDLEVSSLLTGRVHWKDKPSALPAQGKPCPPADTAAGLIQDVIHGHSLQRCRSAAAVPL